MQRRFEVVRANTALQNLWTRRVIAFVIDSLILLIVFVVLNAVLALVLFVPLLVFNVNAFGGLFSGFSAIFGLIIVWGYYVALEGSTGATIGKRFVDVKVRSLEGTMKLYKGFCEKFHQSLASGFRAPIRTRSDRWLRDSR